MMFSNADEIRSLVLKQLKYKLETGSGLLLGLIFLQLFGFLISMGGFSQGSNGIISFKNITGDGILVFSMMWIFSFAITLGAKQFKDMDFIFPGNRSVSSLSNIALLAAAALYAAITAQLMGYVLKAVVYFSLQNTDTIAGKPIVSISAILLGIFMTFLYMLLTSGIAYLAGAVFQSNKAYIAIVPIAFILAIFIAVRYELGYMEAIWKFIFAEGNIGIFIIKALVISTIAFSLGSLIYNKLEVRK